MHPSKYLGGCTMATLLRAGAPTRPPQLASSTWAYFARFARHPRRTWTRLLADPARLRYGFVAVLLVGFGYAGTVGAIALSHGRPSMPWLAITDAYYFTLQAYFIAPITCL